MSDEYSGEMLVGLMRMVEKIASSRTMRSFHIGHEEAELEHLRDLLGTANDTPLKAAMMNLIDRLKTDNPDLAEVNAAMEEVERLWPNVAPGAAVSVNLL